MRGRAVVALLLATGCGDGVEESDPPPPPPAQGCLPGEAARDDGTCEPAGIPDSACGGAVVSDGARGVVAVLPPARCPRGQMAVPGETVCRPVAPCASGRWPEVPMGGSILYVDGSYTGGNNDGTQARPLTTIQQAVTKATSGATIAIASGTYQGDLVVTHESLRLWGVCPESVVIEGTGAELAAVVIANPGASASELHDLTVTGPRLGVLVVAATDVVLEQVWIRDTGSRGLNVQDDGATSVTLRGSLIEATAEYGIFAAGVGLSVAHSVVRDVAGTGIEVDDSFGLRSHFDMVGSLVEGHTQLGIFVYGSDASIDTAVIRDADASFVGDGAGRGIIAELDAATAQRTNLSMTCSVLERNRDVAMFVDSSDASLQHVAVRDTLPQTLDQRYGRGILVQDFVGGNRATGHVVESLVERSHETGVSAVGSDVTAISVLVRDVQPQLADGSGGFGMNIEESDIVAGQRGNATVRSSLIQGSHELGLFVLGSDALIEDTAVIDTQARATDQYFGRGVSIQDRLESGARSSATIRRSLVERSVDSGITIISSDAVLEEVVVSLTAKSFDQLFGDGISVVTALTPASAAIQGGTIMNNARAGIGNFGGTVSLGTTTIGCNAIALNAERFEGFEGVFEDLGGNLCGCQEAMAECKVQSSSLTPPEPVSHD